MGKKFMTVRGIISEDDIGITLPHEHLLVDVRNWMKPLPKEASLRQSLNLNLMLNVNIFIGRNY